jgi:GNAT superfamily N-acetyltransferase
MPEAFGEHRPQHFAPSSGLRACNQGGTRRAVEAPLLAADLAPGDRGVAARDWSDLRARRVLAEGDEDFELAYQTLWREFGARGEMERRSVISERLTWDPSRPHSGAALAYELLVLRRGDRAVAVRDHSAVLRFDAGGSAQPGPIVVHLSHAYIDPGERGQGLAGWLRALPLQAARRCAQALGCAPSTPVVLVAEMEAPDPSEPMRAGRLRSYGRAGFRAVDPSATAYAQPDFRPESELAGAAPRAVPLQLVIRRVGREDETSIGAGELRAIVESIYAVYSVHVPERSLREVRVEATDWLRRRERFELLPPLA